MARTILPSPLNRGACRAPGQIIEVSSGLGDTPDDDRAIAFLALLSGSVTLARAVRDPALAKRIADAVERYAVVIAERTDVQPDQRA
ncbi:hypothetical protein [Burkholderia sp. BCC1977]|uniref:hypothetical protein n=1 Tax=Burkholderia sp. BCC1977 TaxID=2817440 RepID=UPI002ABE1E43|nr:hypothetical protein [Burkholderia sp. BCC1977]